MQGAETAYARYSVPHVDQVNVTEYEISALL